MVFNPRVYKFLNSDLTKWLLGGLISLMCSGVIFYFKTKDQLNDLSQDLIEVKVEMKEIKNGLSRINTNPEYNDQFKNETKERLSRMEQRLDKQYDILIDLSNKK